ncbi:MAG TPA: 3-hydroxyacyl-CoA dehydrogenase/enoyl-CoA hydratase family protein [Myxococcota bacterium]|nr:3-hydroxyacyl-CoA dehydrogenase/enoyl-CoA hydratase family protein [Myxococcota bacterium]
MSRKIEKAAVLGAGIMGTGIAAHLANCGISSYLLDIVPRPSEEEKKKGVDTSTPAFRNKLATDAVKSALKNRKPIPSFYHDSFAELITCGNFEDNMYWLAECDWVIEVVVENLEIKRKVFTNIEKHMKPGAVISSNTSGLPIKEMVTGRSEAFKRQFLVTHFFNPVRFMRLLEIVAGADSDPEIVEFMADFGTNVLGKGVVFGKDTPNFVGNRIGIYGMMRTLKEMIDNDYTIEEVDAIVGQPMGRPKSAAFRTIDMVGLDTVVHITNKCHESLTDDEAREIFIPPDFIKTMIERKQFGNKTKGGFYKKGKDKDGKKQIMVLDWKTGEYRPKEKVRFDSVGVAKNTDDVNKRVKDLIAADDRAGKYAWAVMSDSLIYSANRVGEIAADIMQIDNAMKWGYNWNSGPFEAWDAVGFKDTCERIKKDGKKLPPIAEAILAAGGAGFYKSDNGKRMFFDLESKSYKPVREDPKKIWLPALKEQKREIDGNTSATLVDLGDGVICCEFHSKMNAIDDDVIRMMHAGLDLLEKNDDYIGMVIGNHGENFCVGANVMLLLMNAKAGNWDDVEFAVKAFQDTCMRLKYSPKPVVAAPFAMTLGGGMEISMGADRICAHADLFMGQVEMGVGLIPGGGGNKELLIRYTEGIPESVQNPNLTPYLQGIFEAIGMAKVTMSADEARALKFLRPSDKIVTNKEHVLHTAKRMVQAMHLEGYKQPLQRLLKLPGENGFATFRMVIDSMCKQHQITGHEQVIAEKLSWVLCGGKTSQRIAVSEQYLLDLEREAFLFLLGTEKTQERISYFLMNGKPLRN